MATEKEMTYSELKAAYEMVKAENDAIKQDRVNRQAKNSVFLNLFMRKEYQLQLYKELFPEDTDLIVPFARAAELLRAAANFL